jgi:serine phosphatase RsbU (regulator of sigma subunit)
MSDEANSQDGQGEAPLLPERIQLGIYFRDVQKDIPFIAIQDGEELINPNLVFYAPAGAVPALVLEIHKAIKGVITAGSSDRIDAAIELKQRLENAGVKDDRLVAEETDINFQLLSRDEQIGDIKTLRASISRRLTNERQRQFRAKKPARSKKVRPNEKK